VLLAALALASCGTTVPRGSLQTSSVDLNGAAPGTGAATPSTGVPAADAPAASSSVAPGTGTADGQPLSTTPADVGAGVEAGVNPTLPPIRLGYTVVDLTGGETTAIVGGVSGFDLEAQKRASEEQLRALIRYANETGGVGGRKIVGYQTTVSTDDGLDDNKRLVLCTAATEDQKVSVMIDTDAFYTEPDLACFARHKTTIATIIHSASAAFIRQNRPYLATMYAVPERTELALVQGLQSVGYFKGARLGVMLDDEPVIRSVYANVMKPWLKAHGISVLQEEYFSPTDPSQQASQASSAVLAFRSQSIDHVIVATNILPLIAFMNAARSSNYLPRYGLGDYQIVASAAAGNAASVTTMQAAMKDAVAVTVAQRTVQVKPTSANAIPKDARVIGPGLKRCLDVLSKETKQDYYTLASDHRGRNYAAYCDSFFMWLDAARRVGPTVGPSTWGSGLTGVGGGFQPAYVHQTLFSPERFAGAVDYHVGIYYDADVNCRCYKDAGAGYLRLPD